MSSNIDTTIPPFGNPTTAGVRNNFSAAKDEIEALQNSVGWCDASHSGTTQAITADTSTKLLNDATGDYCAAYLPNGMSPLWNATANQFDFGEVPLHTMVDLRIDIELTTTSLNQEAEIEVRFGVVSASEFGLVWGPRMYYKSAGVKKVCCYNGYYIGSEDIKNYPAEIRIWTDDSATVKVNGWYSRIITPIFEL